MGDDNFDERSQKFENDLNSALGDGIDLGRRAINHQKRNHNRSGNTNSEAQKNNEAANKAASYSQHAQNANNVKQGAEAAKSAKDGAETAKTGAEAANTAKEAGQAGAEMGKAAVEAGKAGAEGGKVAAEAGTAAGTGGLSLIPDAVFGAFKGAKSTLADMTDPNTSEQESPGLFGSIFKVVFIILIIIIMFCFGASFYTGGVASSQNENNQEIQYNNLGKRNKKSERNNEYIKKDKKAITKKLDTDFPFEYSAKDYKEKTNEALEYAFKEHAIAMIEAMKAPIIEKIAGWIEAALTDGFVYNESKTLQYFLDNPYPYSLKISMDHWYTIGDYLYTIGYDGRDKFDSFSSLKSAGHFKIIPEDRINDDLNYAEFTSVISQGEDYQTMGGTFEDFKKMFTEDENQELMFEMTLKDFDKGDPTFYEGYYYETTVDSEGNVHYEYVQVGPYHDKDNPEFDKCIKKWYFYKPIVKPWGLRELYKIAGVEDDLVEDDVQPGDQAAANHPPDKVGYDDGIMNYEILDFTEKYDRVYARMGDLGNAGVRKGENYLGPSCLEQRNKLSTIYYEKHTIDGKPLKTGRSANYYVPLKYLINTKQMKDIRQRIWDFSEDDNGLELIDPQLLESLQLDDGLMKNILVEALSHLNEKYLWGGTGNGGYDCSGLMQASFAKYGISIPRTAKAQYDATVEVPAESARPGDLVFFHDTGGRTGITHVGMYIGNGQFVEAKGSKWGIVVSDLSKRAEKFSGYRRVIVPEDNAKG